jgi:uncharacterized protein YkwD
VVRGVVGVVNIGYQHAVMLVLATGLVTLWAGAVLVVLAVCRSAARADARRRVVRGAAVGLAAAAAAGAAATPDDAAAACANRDVRFRAAPVAVRAALVCEIQRVRARRGAGRLRPAARLDRAARRHAADMVRRRYFSHVTPGGLDPGDRVRRSGYPGRCAWRIGEVLAWGAGRRSTARATVRAWLRSPPHRRILLSGRYQDLGIAMRAGTPVGRYRSGVTAAAVLGARHC